MSLGANTMSTLVVPNSGCRTIAAFNAFLQIEERIMIYMFRKYVNRIDKQQNSLL